MQDIRGDSPKFFEERIVVLLHQTTRDFRLFHSRVNLSMAIRNAEEFFSLWAESGNDTTTEFLRIAKELTRNDIVNELNRVYCL